MAGNSHLQWELSSEYKSFSKQPLSKSLNSINHYLIYLQDILFSSLVRAFFIAWMQHADKDVRMDNFSLLSQLSDSAVFVSAPLMTC